MKKLQVRRWTYHRVNTANGEIVVDKYVMVRVRELGITVKAMVLKDSPSVLSLGKLVDEHGFEYRWTKFKAPILISEDGKIVKCRTANFVPRITPIDEVRGAKAYRFTSDGEHLDGNIDISPNEPGTSSTGATHGSRSAQQINQGQDRGAKAFRCTGDIESESVQDSFPSQENDEGRVIPGYAGSKRDGKASGGQSTEVRGAKAFRLQSDVNDEVLYGPPPPKATRKRKQKRISSVSASHNMFTHFPKDPNCRVCQLTKTTRARVTTKAEKAPDDLPQPKEFADAITADHAVLNEEDTSRDGDQIVLVIQDGYTKWLQSIPCKTKSAHET